MYDFVSDDVVNKYTIQYNLTMDSPCDVHTTMNGSGEKHRAIGEQYAQPLGCGGGPT